MRSKAPVTFDAANTVRVDAALDDNAMTHRTAQ
jgi:hypothetical protein